MPERNFSLRAAHLGKRYQLGQASSLDDGIREALGSGMQHIARALRRGRADSHDAQKPARELIWALREVSFTVEPGTAIGLIGRNGAGKSTLLKILSRITPPTTGEVWVNGRIASLLEIGTGFQADLTGRENVFLNGAILGMRRREVHAHFDAIVAFAQLERFIDTPVKRYSTGMFMRLAFSVAVHLDADILLMDEVLAVGDLEFQKRCLQKMNEITGDGRTVVFVSHKLGAVRRLCQRALYLHQGCLRADGPTEDVLSRYLRDTLDLGTQTRHHGRGVRFTRWSLGEKPRRRPQIRTQSDDHSDTRGYTRGNTQGDIEGDIEGDEHSCVAGDTVTFNAQLTVGAEMDHAWFQFALWSEDDEVVLSATSRDGGRPALMLQAGMHTLAIRVRLPLRDGHYAVELALCNEHGMDVERIELPPRLIVLPREDRVLPRERRGVLEESVEFTCTELTTAGDEFR